MLAPDDDPLDGYLRAQVTSRLAQETYHVQRFDEAKGSVRHGRSSCSARNLQPGASGLPVLDDRAGRCTRLTTSTDRLRLAGAMID